MKKKVIIGIGVGLAAILGISLGIWLLKNDSTKTTPEEKSGEDVEETSDSDTEREAVRLIFIHHSCGENWLADSNGGLGIALKQNNYYVSDTNYGWGPDSIGDSTDIGHWWTWFRGPNSETYLSALYSEDEQNSEYSRLENKPGGENEIIMFKSCYPNSALKGNPEDPIPSISSNGLKGESVDSEYHTVANAKGIYIDLLEYFETMQDKFFVVVAAPPLSDSTYADNTQEFNDWLANDWLDSYGYNNVMVFDFYSVLMAEGNYSGSNGDDHPSKEGNIKATEEFVPFLNSAYQLWK